jgi:predicted DCC family thiol-disulfide oxidoreductase YuxK
MKKLIVFYDGWCPLCQKAKKSIESADKRKRIVLLSFRDPEVQDHFEIDLEKADKRIFSINEINSKSYYGIHTIVQIAKRIPKFRIAVPFLYISILLGFGQKVYDYIASKRNIVPVGQCDEHGCPVHFKGGDKDE